MTDRIHRNCRGQVGAMFVSLLSGMLLFAPSARAEGLTRVTFGAADQPARTVEGRIVVEAADGGIVLLDRGGRLWNVTPAQLKERGETETPFAPLTSEEMAGRLREEFGDGFEIVTTRHYVVCSSAGTKYAEWCGALFERLMTAFLTHWKGKPLDLHEPEFPLMAVVFADAKQFAEFAARDVGPQVADAKGYYSVASNRMVLYDLTADLGGRPATTVADLNEKIAASPFNVATVIHEATHQIAFNCGLHTRYADNPLWLTEGLAMYFETPDLRSRTGWRTIGRPNPHRLAQFRDSARNRRKPDSLTSLLTTSERFTDSEQAADAYAEAWAFTYFLIKTKRQLYTEYLDRLSEKKPLVFGTPEERLAEFQAVFGDDLEKLDREFVRYVERVGR